MSLITASHFYFQFDAILASKNCLATQRRSSSQSPFSIGYAHNGSSSKSYKDEGPWPVCANYLLLFYLAIIARKKSSTATFCTQ